MTVYISMLSEPCEESPALKHDTTENFVLTELSEWLLKYTWEDGLVSSGDVGVAIRCHNIRVWCIFLMCCSLYIYIASLCACLVMFQLFH